MSENRCSGLPKVLTWGFACERLQRAAHALDDVELRSTRWRGVTDVAFFRLLGGRDDVRRVVVGVGALATAEVGFPRCGR